MADIWVENFESATGATSQVGVTRSTPNHAAESGGDLTGSSAVNGAHEDSSDYSFVTNGTTSIAGSAVGGQAAFTGFSGFYYAAEDVDGISSSNGFYLGGADTDFVEYTGIDISGFANLSFSGLFAAATGTHEDENFLRIEVQIDGGGYVTVLSFDSTVTSGGGNLAVDTNGDGIGDGTNLGLAAALVTAGITGTGSVLDLRVTFNSNSGSEEIGFDDLKISGDSQIVGDGMSNILTGDADDNVIQGLAGRDFLFGLGGDDRLEGGDDNDKLEGGIGADELIGGDGRDTAKYNNAAEAVTVDLATGGTVGEAAGDTYDSVERVEGSNFGDTITGDANNNVLIGRGGEDTLNGGAGDDVLRGGADNDTLNGGDNNDRMIGDGGADVLNGGDGRDTADYSRASSSVTVNIDTTASGVGQAQGDSWVSIERFFLTDNDDTFIGSTASSQDDLVRGFDGADMLFGNAGQDILRGDEGADTLNGGTGIDRLYGGIGDDILTGGSDKDVFYFEANAGADTITDWQNNLDRIVFLSSSGATQFSDLLIETSVADANDVTITYNGNVLTIENAATTDFDAGDFNFI